MFDVWLKLKGEFCRENKIIILICLLLLFNLFFIFDLKVLWFKNKSIYIILFLVW